LNQVTFSGNNSLVSGGDAIRNATNSNPQVRNSILWGDVNDEVLNDGTSNITLAYAVVQGGCPATADFLCSNIVSSNPSLGALANNSGYTQTMAITVSSSAYNAGNNATCAATDQRGIAR